MVTKLKQRKTAPSQNPPPLAVLPPITSTTTTTFPPPLSICPPPPPQPPPPSSADEEASVKLALAISLLKSKLLSQPQRQQPQPQQQQQQSLSSDALRWKHKAKERKNEILRLKQEIKQLEDDMQCDLYPQSASCKCYFFNDMEKENINTYVFDKYGLEFSGGGDHQYSRFSDSLRRRFLRQVRLNERKKKRAVKNAADRRHSFSEFCKEEEEMEQLKLSADFLVDLCETPCTVKNPHFTNLAHQAVDFILGSLNHFIAMGKDLNFMEDVTCSLIMRLVKRMCEPIGDVLYDRKNDMQTYVQHIIRKLASFSFVGQRVLLSVSHRISDDAEKMFSLDPFDKAFPLIHESMFFMIQLVESLVSSYLVTWSKDEGFDTRLFQEWVTSLLHSRKALQLLEKRSGLYILYMDRVIGELAGQVGQFSSFQKLNENIIDNLYS